MSNFDVVASLAYMSSLFGNVARLASKSEMKIEETKIGFLFIENFTIGLQKKNLVNVTVKCDMSHLFFLRDQFSSFS